MTRLRTTKPDDRKFLALPSSIDMASYDAPDGELVDVEALSLGVVGTIALVRNTGLGLGSGLSMPNRGDEIERDKRFRELVLRTGVPSRALLIAPVLLLLMMLRPRSFAMAFARV
jgi:hypothetical protein